MGYHILLGFYLSPEVVLSIFSLYPHMNANDKYCFQPVLHETEVESYDFYNFMGDVGGVFGLLLGWSLLSAYDGCKIWLRSRRNQWEAAGMNPSHGQDISWIS